MCFESIFFSYFRYCDGELFVTGCAILSSPSSFVSASVSTQEGKMYFSVTRARSETEREGLNRVSCRRETARPPPLPTGECMQLPPDGGVYITRARKTATRPTELRPSLRLSLSTATNFRLEISAGTHVLELLKFGRTFDGKKGKQSLK